MPSQAEVDAEHHARQAALAVLALQAARRSWRRLDARDVAAWRILAGPLRATLTAVQYAAAVDGAASVGASLAAAGVTAPAVATVVPGAFAGVASDGRSLATLLDQPRIRVLARIGAGMPVPAAMASGLSALETIAVTQVQDSGRGAAGVGITARPRVAGYVRYLNPPSCSRCAVLAGQFYRWNAGFKRHPRCDCRHRPVSQQEYAADSYRDPGNTPKAYFESLSHAEQDRLFTSAGARAIRDGADLTRVVNARRGGQLYTASGDLLTRESVTRRGVARTGQPRAMPETIYTAAGDDRDEALRLLALHGFVR